MSTLDGVELAQTGESRREKKMEGNSSEYATSSEFSRLHRLYSRADVSSRRLQSTGCGTVVAIGSGVGRSWRQFLPEDYQQILARSPESASLRDYSKKDLFFRLCNSERLLIDEGKKMFWLERGTGKKCYMLGARELSIAWGDTRRYWEWFSVPESQFPEIAFLNDVCWLQIKGTIDGGMFSRETKYGAYLVFNFCEDSHGFGDVEVKSSMKAEGDVHEGVTKSHYLQRRRPNQWVMPGAEVRSEHVPYPTERKDGWLEIELGDFYTTSGEDGDHFEVEITQLSGHWKRGLILEGIEIRPKHS